MSAAPADPLSAPADEGDDAFAATIAEELNEHDDPEALPGAMAVDARPLHSLPTTGHVGRYALKYQLGAGGLGTVHAALDPLLSRPIAVKTLRVDAAADEREALEARLLAEARAAAGLNHPNIVTIYDAGLAEEGVYIAMERLQGRDLRELLADGWRPAPAQAARIAKRLADALAYAHSHGVIHCDIKPANIYMIGRTQPKLLDFGIARVAQQQAAPAARQAQALDAGPEVALEPAAPTLELGSPYYVAPEHLRGEALDLRCDVYGVGVVLYELLAGHRAFDGRTLDGIRQAVLEAELAPLHGINPQVDSGLAAIVERAMARNPAGRYRSARQLARALRGWLDEDASRQSGAPLRGSSAPWAAFAGLGLAAAVGFWVLVSGVFWQPAPPTPAGVASAAQREAALPSAARAPAPLADTPPADVSPVTANSASAQAPIASAAAARLAKPAAAAAALASRARLRKGANGDVAPPEPAAPPVNAQGTVQLAISPWGQVEVDGVAAGTTPPLSRLTLPAGRHQIVIRNDDFTPFTATVTVDEDKPVTLRHRFGS